jgi:heterodisulfide reductase subunit A
MRIVKHFAKVYNWVKRSEIMSEHDSELKIGVFLCGCGRNIAATVDIDKVARQAKKLKDVVFVDTNKYSCSETGQASIRAAIRENKLNRVVVASCSPKLHLETFKETTRSAGVNPYLIEMANIREHCSWVHQKEPVKATQKAFELVEMAIAKARLLEPQIEPRVRITPSCMVIGGGVAGIQASLDLADSGYHVYLIEKSPSIGGIMATLDKTFPTMDCSICILGPKMSDVKNHPNITLMAFSEVKEVTGYVGNFKAKILRKACFVTDECTACDECTTICPISVPNETDGQLSWRKAIYIPFPQAVPSKYLIDTEHCHGVNPISCGKCREICREKGADCINYDDRDKIEDIEVGTIIISTGFSPFDAARIPEYGWGRYPNVITTLEFERLFNASGPTQGHLVRPGDMKPPNKVAFIQCVGSRDHRFNSYCSNFCCLETIKSTLLIKEHWPETEVTVFYVDIRAFGKGFEELYNRSRGEGVIFVRGRPSEIQEDPDTNNLLVFVEDQIQNRFISPEFDMVVLSIGADAPPANVVPIPLARGADGFLLEAHPKLKPVDTASRGIFIAGGVESPKDIKESVTQASAAAMRAAQLMARGEVKIEPIFAEVDATLCTACGLCTTRCPYGAITVKEKKVTPAVVNKALCEGCGTCAADCPEDCIRMRHFTDDQIMAQVQAALRIKPESKVLLFACTYCSYGGADLAGISRMQYATNGRVIRTMCAGRVDPDFVYEAFKLGAGAVALTGCHPQDCHFISGNAFAAKREKRIRRWLEKNGIQQERFVIEWISAGEGKKFQSLMQGMCGIAGSYVKTKIKK